MQRLAVRPNEYAKILFVGFVVLGQFFAVVLLAVTYMHALIGWNTDRRLLFCSIKGACSVAFPALQFVCWILLFRFLFVKAKNNLLDCVSGTPDIIGNGTSVKSINYRVQYSLQTIKNIVEMKSRVTRLYGSFVLLYPVGWLTALLHTCSLLSTDIRSVHVAILLVHAIASLLQFYLPFWSCQIATVSVSFKHLRQRWCVFYLVVVTTSEQKCYRVLPE